MSNNNNEETLPNTVAATDGDVAPARKRAVKKTAAKKTTAKKAVKKTATKKDQNHKSPPPTESKKH